MLSARPGATAALSGDGLPTGRGWYRRGDWIALLLLLLAVVALQALSGALTAELVNADEPAHFVSGLMIRDYLLGGFVTPPMEYAYSYYAHYPKIGIGNWPPLFYALEASWMLAFPAQPRSVLLLVAVLTALLGWLVFRTLHPALGTAHAAFGAGLLIMMRPVRSHTGMIMLENALALATFVALLLWVRYLERGRVRDAMAFGAAAIGAMLIKGNAVFLVLLPPLAIIFGRRWAVLRSRGLWLAAGLVLLVVAPLLFYFLADVTSGWRSVLPSAAHAGSAALAYAEAPLLLLGFVGTILCGLGIWERVVSQTARAAADSALWVSAAALVAAVVTVHVLVPADIATRHLIPACAGLAMFTAAGAHAGTRWLRGRGLASPTAAALVLGGALLAFFVDAWTIHPKVASGFSAAAATVLEHADTGEQTTSLILSDAVGEGAFIVEVARRDERRPSHIVWRGTNLLSQSTWAGRNYRLRAETEEELVELLVQAGVQYVVVDRTARYFRHQRQFDRLLVARPDLFSFVAEMPRVHGERSSPRGLAVYSVTLGDAQRARPAIRQVPGYEGFEQTGAE